MKISEIAALVKGEILSAPQRADEEVNTAFASDMMSDVLAFVHDQGLLITGLANPQVVRTAEMLDIACIMLVRGKRPDETMLKLADQKDIVFICSPLRMFEASGILYQAGMRA